MKKKFLASLLCLSLAFSSNIVSLAEPQEDPATSKVEHDTDGDEHGESDESGGAKVSEEDSDFDKDGNNVAGDTQFYINIDKDADENTVKIPDIVIEIGNEDAGVCHYEFNWEIEREAQISATVPLYVCMYGYGGTGTVITPDENSYSIKNDSTYSDKKSLTKITPYYKVTKIQKKDEYVTEDIIDAYIDAVLESSNEYSNYTGTLEQFKEDDDIANEIEKFKASDEVNENVYNSYLDSLKPYLNIAKDAEVPQEYQSGIYGFYYDNDGESYTVIELSKCGKHDSDNGTCKVGDYFIKGDDVNTIDIGGTTYTVNETLKVAADEAYIPLNVPTIRTEASWALKSAGEVGSLKAKQLFMSINDLDLSKVNNSNSFGESNTLDIKYLNWVVPAATSSSAPGTLELPIEAAIAGGNVNDEGCVPVVKVTYLVSPAYDNDDANFNHEYVAPPSDES